MKSVLFYLSYSLIWLITLLPLRILYLLSDFLYFLVFHVNGYRKNTVLKNLRLSFPEKSPKEISQIARTFYHQLTDYFLEWMYRMHMGEMELSRRMRYKNPEIFEKFKKEGRNIILLLSHHGNWEWQIRPVVTEYTPLLVYKPLENKYFDRLFLKLREKYGSRGVQMKLNLRTILNLEKEGIPVLVYTLADQRPQFRSRNHWTSFLNQECPVITGPERIARKFDMVTVFLKISRVRRGYYEGEFELISENPNEEPPFNITRRYLGLLENLIREEPALYLWTHKRWKYHRKQANHPQDIGIPLY